MSEVDLPGEPTPASDTMLRLERAMEKYAPAGYDPASDDLTIPFAMELVEKDRKIEAAAKVIAALREGIADAIRDLLASRDEGDVIESLKGTLELASTYEQNVGKRE